MSDLKLLALDNDDLAVISAHTQDAVVKVGDMGYAKGEKRFVLLMNRYAWEAHKKGKGHRKRAGLHFDYVQNAAAHGFDLKKTEGVLDLLAITFAETDAPAGEIVLTFAGGARVTLTVECLEARLRDLGGEWAAIAEPRHDMENETFTTDPESQA